MAIFSKMQKDECLLKRDNGVYYVNIKDSYGNFFRKSLRTRSYNKAKLLIDSEYPRHPVVLNLSLSRISINDFFRDYVKTLDTIEFNGDVYNIVKVKSVIKLNISNCFSSFEYIIKALFYRYSLRYMIDQFTKLKLELLLEEFDNFSLLAFLYVFLNAISRLYPEEIDYIKLFESLKSVSFKYLSNKDLSKLAVYDSKYPLQNYEFLYFLAYRCLDVLRGSENTLKPDERLKAIEAATSVNSECKLMSILDFFQPQLARLHFTNENLLKTDKNLDIHPSIIKLRWAIMGNLYGSYFNLYVNKHAPKILEVLFHADVNSNVNI